MAFLKKQRIKGHDLALINVAGLADRPTGALRICIGACAVTPVLLSDLDSLYKDTKDTEKLAERVAELSERAISPIDDVRCSKEYRKDMVRVFVKRLVRQICSGG
jgi:carbon-monoxide dehydrogenase medium subunit